MCEVVFNHENSNSNWIVLTCMLLLRSMKIDIILYIGSTKSSIQRYSLLNIITRPFYLLNIPSEVFESNSKPKRMLKGDKLRR